MCCIAPFSQQRSTLPCLGASCTPSAGGTSRHTAGGGSTWRPGSCICGWARGLRNAPPLTRSLGTSAAPGATGGGAVPHAGARVSPLMLAPQHAQPLAAAGAAAVQQQPRPVLQIRGVCKRKNLPLGWKKIDFVLPLVRRRLVDDAMAQLSVSPRKAARLVMHAVANARGNAMYAGGPLADPARLLVDEVFVTKGAYSKKLAIMGRGYNSVMLTRRSHLTVTVRQLETGEAPPSGGSRRGPRSRRNGRGGGTRLVSPLLSRRSWWSRRPAPRVPSAVPETSLA